MRSAPPGAYVSGPLNYSPARAAWAGLPRRGWLALALLVALISAGCGTTHVQFVAVPTATHLSVALTTDFANYSASQAIGVTVTNAARQSLYAMDNHSECTILQLQQFVQGTWTDIMPCETGQPPNLLLIAPGPGVPYTLAPGNSHDSPNAWDPGVYRVALMIGSKSDGSNLTTAVYSAGFQVRAPS